jgi:hypothetical protein
MNVAFPPRLCASAITLKARVVFPELSKHVDVRDEGIAKNKKKNATTKNTKKKNTQPGPNISTIRPRGRPPF